MVMPPPMQGFGPSLAGYRRPPSTPGFDDEASMVEALRRGLTAEGMTVDVTHTGNDALWRAGAAHYDAIVMDVMMPGLDGVSACRRMRDEGVERAPADLVPYLRRDHREKAGRLAAPFRAANKARIVAREQIDIPFDDVSEPAIGRSPDRVIGQVERCH